jgi:hypothetical protein
MDLHDSTPYFPQLNATKSERDKTACLTDFCAGFSVPSMSDNQTQELSTALYKLTRGATTARKNNFLPASVVLTLRHGLCLGMVYLAILVSGAAPQTYQKPPQPILDILHAPITPDVFISPTRDRLLLIDRDRYLSIVELAQPVLAGTIQLNMCFSRVSGGFFMRF